MSGIEAGAFDQARADHQQIPLACYVLTLRRHSLPVPSRPRSISWCCHSFVSCCAACCLQMFMANNLSVLHASLLMTAETLSILKLAQQHTVSCHMRLHACCKIAAIKKAHGTSTHIGCQISGIACRVARQSTLTTPLHTQLFLTPTCAGSFLLFITGMWCTA